VTITKGSGKVEGLSLTNICFVGATSCVKLVGTGLTDFVADMKLEKLYGYPYGGTMLDLGWVLDINHTNCIHVNPGVGFQFLGDANGVDNVPIKDTLIDDIVANGADTYILDHHDSIMMSQIFAFATRTTMRITNSYGKIINYESDQCTTGLYYSGAAGKDLQLIAYRCVPSAGPTPSGRNAILFDGGGYLSVLGTGDLGSNTAVPSSSSPSANSYIKCSGGILNIDPSCRIHAQSGAWTTPVDPVGGTTIVGSVSTF
jgi:hypothetical protein